MNLSAITPENLTIITKRLTLSLMTVTDLNHFSLLQTDVELMKYIGPILSDEEINNKFLDRIKPFDGKEGHWIALNIHENNSNNFMGTIGFKLDSITDQRFEIGYLILKQFGRRGYVTEAGHAIVNFLLNNVGVKKIVAHCATDNIGSWKVMGKIGLHREGEFKSDHFLNDIWYDSYAYGLINPHFSKH
ncbi:GNAT family N-acetyltransferase [Shewanella sp. VB17]|uniref:GNAT family N-acetyltransferase n=1 Tax=Shewanella sp. VB17 TaxID=2739432 RepID=UPI0015672587|nr:GNAT family N-acetyltransferase [Shewanella sp. VB17]NRD73462.1 GNAT family N-acetyltransferase [Shewanella sp. VB17]